MVVHKLISSALTVFRRLFRQPLRFTDRKEAVKARRAWQLYVPAAERKHLRGSVRRIGKSEAFLVMVTERAGD